jgi:hypothetical protein
MRIEQTTVVYMDDGKQVVLSPDALMAIGYMLAMNDHVRAPALILAIKYVRVRYALGLKEAKDIVDELRSKPNVFNR